MRARLLVATAVGWLLFAPVAVSSQNNQGVDGEVEIGAWDSDSEDSPDVVTEYESTDGGPDLDLWLSMLRDTGALALTADVRDGNDLVVGLKFDVARTIRSETELVRMLHRLGHKPVEHFAAVTDHGRLVRNTDLDPGDIYEIDYELLEHRTEIQPSRVGNLTLGIGYRRQTRDGVRQMTAVSHCDSCHVISQSRPIDEVTEQLEADATLAWKGGSVRGSITARELRTDPVAIDILVDDALHPELRLPLFDNRLQFDSAEGPQPLDARPEVSKDTYRLESVFTDVAGFTLTADGIWSETDVAASALKSDYSGYLVTVARGFGKAWSMRWRGRGYSIDSADIFVDTAERLGIAGPQAGKTYQEIYGFDPDFLRQSSLDRQVLESKLDLSYRLGRKAGRLRLGWEYEEIDRDHYEVAPGQTVSATNVLSASWRARPKKGWKTQLAYEHGETDHPFAFVDGAFSQLSSPAVPSPFDPLGAQYFESHEARIADPSASPASWDEAKLRASYSGAKTTIAGSYRWWDGENTDGDFNDWGRNVEAATVSLWSTPSPSWEWHVALSRSESELDLAATIPLFDG